MHLLSRNTRTDATYSRILCLNSINITLSCLDWCSQRGWPPRENHHWNDCVWHWNVGAELQKKKHNNELLWNSVFTGKQNVHVFRRQRCRWESSEGVKGCNFTWSTRQTHCVWEDCTSSWPFGKLSLSGGENSRVTWRRREFNHWPKKTRRDDHCGEWYSHFIGGSADGAGRCKSKRNATTFQSSSSGLCFITANTQSAPAHLQTCFASLPLVTQHTEQGENQSPHKKSRWEYIIWSEKQFVLAISCLCAEVISLSSSISAGNSYWVGGGHYTTWLQNLHRPLQRPGSLSERNPRWGRLCQIMFWLRLDDNNTPGFMVVLSESQHPGGGGGACSLLWTLICVRMVKILLVNTKKNDIWFRLGQLVQTLIFDCLIFAANIKSDTFLLRLKKQYA